MKKVFKNPIKFKVQLAPDQKEAKALILDSKISVVIGQAGSGKTLIAANIALDLLFTKQIERILISRPTVSDMDSDDIGFLPGDIEDKLSPFTTPVLDNMYKLYDKIKIDELIKEGKIVVKTLQHIKGITIDNELLIVDEVEDMTEGQILKVLTRLGKDSKIIFSGDIAQCDLRSKENSGLLKLIQVATSLDYMKVIELITNHRDPIIQDIIKAFK